MHTHIKRKSNNKEEKGEREGIKVHFKFCSGRFLATRLGSACSNQHIFCVLYLNWEPLNETNSCSEFQVQFALSKMAPSQSSSFVDSQICSIHQPVQSMAPFLVVLLHLPVEVPVVVSSPHGSAGLNYLSHAVSSDSERRCPWPLLPPSLLKFFSLLSQVLQFSLQILGPRDPLSSFFSSLHAILQFSTKTTLSLLEWTLT